MPTATTVRFRVVVPVNNWFAVGFGKTMSSCDMVIWESNGKNSACYDLWSYGETTPEIDQQQDYTTTFTYNKTHTVFTSDRKLNTGDVYDFIIPTVSEVIW